MTENIITRDEAIDRMKAGLPCETYRNGRDAWCPTEWADFDYDGHLFRKPPEPRRVAQDYWIYNGDVFTHRVHADAIHAREVLRGDVVLQRMTEAAWRRFYVETFGYRGDQSTFIEFVRALGLIGEGS